MAYPLLQTPKTKEFFGGFMADPGHKLIYADASSLEPSIIAYYSRDTNMLKLFQKGRPKNDPYLFFGASVGDYKAKFAALGYDRDNPTPQAIKAVKAEYADVRGLLLKRGFLALNFGAWPPRILEELKLGGLPDATIEDAQGLFDGYWETFSGVKAFGIRLKKQWHDNGGNNYRGAWILGPRGEPITIPAPYKFWNEKKGRMDRVDYTKDIINRFIQRCGHDVHMRMQWHLNCIRHKEKLKCTPFHTDWHDSLTWQAPDEEVDRTVEAYIEAGARLNAELGWDVIINYHPKVGKTMADFIED